MEHDKEDKDVFAQPSPLNHLFVFKAADESVTVSNISKNQRMSSGLICKNAKHSKKDYGSFTLQHAVNNEILNYLIN